MGLVPCLRALKPWQHASIFPNGIAYALPPSVPKPGSPCPFPTQDLGLVLHPPPARIGEKRRICQLQNHVIYVTSWPCLAPMLT